MLAKELGCEVTERRISWDEWREGAADGRITEVFGCGTAAVITPIGRVRHHGGEVVIGDGEPGPVGLRLRAMLTDDPARHGSRHPLLDAHRSSPPDRASRAPAGGGEQPAPGRR